jgi:GT2 family glycosyltransferase
MSVTSIIIPSFNEAALLKDCIYSIRVHTHTPYEIIVVDNGSSDDTLAFLRREGITFASFPQNRGFPAACNAGLRLATGSRLMLLNNDVLVSDGWLDHMLSALNASKDTGLVGPMTNYASGKQQINESYTNLHEMAQLYRARYRGQTEQVNRLIGFCLLMKREVLETIGLLDERFSPGHFEDDDYCYRARIAGYKLRIAKASFIFHYGSVSFGKQGDESHKQQVAKSRQKFIEKWGIDPGELI